MFLMKIKENGVFNKTNVNYNCRCCVCLGEFEIKEELLQVISCKHVFHINCIRHWLQSHSTCPLCRTLVATAC